MCEHKEPEHAPSTMENVHSKKPLCAPVRCNNRLKHQGVTIEKVEEKGREPTMFASGVCRKIRYGRDSYGRRNSLIDIMDTPSVSATKMESGYQQ